MAQSTLPLSFAPLEGITGWLFRRVHHSRFPGLARYYTPFSAPTADSPLTGRGLNDVLPEHNEGVPVVPQLLTNKADDFISAARCLQDLGYNEVNLNLGCPSGTVVSKKKGAGFLSDPQGIDAFLDTVFRRLDMTVSVKTRIGVSDPDEWPALLEMFARYPISLLIIHPRLRTDYYKGDVRQEAFAYAVTHYKGPLCYNGDLNTVSDCQRVGACYPRLSELMAGRGLVADPALGRALAGGPPLTQAEFLAFHDELVAGYQEILYGDWPVLGKMKELWTYWANLFPAPQKPLKAMRKAKTLADYRAAVQQLVGEQKILPAYTTTRSR